MQLEKALHQGLYGMLCEWEKEKRSNLKNQNAQLFVLIAQFFGHRAWRQVCS
jgi:hypothetical protein